MPVGHAAGHPKGRDRSTVTIALRPAFSSAENPFVTRFAATLAAAGYHVVELSWAPLRLIRSDIVVLHWPDDFFRGGARMTLKAMTKLALLGLARICNDTKLVWVAHNVRPHEGGGASALTGAFFRRLGGIVYLSRHSRELLREHYPASAAVPSLVTVHGHYRGDLSSPPCPAPPLASGVRLLYFGQVRRYKNVPELIARAAEMSDRDVTLTVVGRCQEAELAGAVARAAKNVPQVRLDVRPTLLSDAEIEAAIDGCHGVVLPYREISNSGAALLALSRNRPLLAPRIGALPELQEAVGADWIQLYEGPLTARALDQFAAFLRLPRMRSSPDLSAYDWDTIGRSVADFFDRLVSGEAAERPAAAAQTPDAPSASAG